MGGLLYKNDFDEARDRLTAWWDGEDIGRPAIFVVGAPKALTQLCAGLLSGPSMLKPISLNSSRIRSSPCLMNRMSAMQQIRRAPMSIASLACSALGQITIQCLPALNAALASFSFAFKTFG